MSMTVTGTNRKEWKKNARRVLRTHYLLLVVLCLIIAFFGTEYNYMVNNAGSYYELVTGKPLENGNTLKLNPHKTREKVLGDLIEDNTEAGNADAAQQLEAYRDGEITGEILGRNRGIFATFANLFSSGKLYMIIFGGLHSIIHSSRFASAFLVLVVMLADLAVWIFLKNMISAILRRMFLEARTYEVVPVSHILHFKLLGRWVRTAMTLLVVYIFELLWWVTIIGGVIKHYSYHLVPFIVAENPDIKPLEAIRLSRRMMKGHKMECFFIDLSYIGWAILGLITFGLTDVFWAVPYKIAAKTEFYAAVRFASKNASLEGTDRLNDRYLYETADEQLLRSTYQNIEETKKYIDEHRVTLTGAKGFFAKYFGFWVGRTAEKKEYDEVDKRRQQIVEDRAAIKGKVYPQRLNPNWKEKNNLVVRNVRSLRTYTIWSLVAAFFVFSFIGWLWEVGIHIVNDGVFVNRGVFHGPWLPIYGGGVVMILFFLAKWRPKPYIEAAAIVILCGFVEYFTSFYLEVTKGMRWWDYTGYFLNLNGRICGEGLLIFALGGMAAVYLLVPVLDSMISAVKPKILKTVCIALLVVFAVDFVYSSIKPNVGEGITDYTAYEEAACIDGFYSPE